LSALFKLVKQRDISVLGNQIVENKCNIIKETRH